jgi:hypothetical protein
LVRSPLRRTTDRVEGVVLTLLVMLALVVIPLAVAVGIEAYQRDAAEAATTTGERTAVTAVLATDAVADYPAGAQRGAGGQRGARPEPTALVRWQLPDGRQGSEQLPVAADRRTGDPLVIWVDRLGERTDPPRSPAEIRTSAVVTGVDLVLVGWLLLAVLWWAACWVLNQINTARWNVQWAYIGPRWSRRSWQ